MVNIKLIHCDLKPENILFTDQRYRDVKIIDFGSACTEFKNGFTYVQSRFYRSPEVALGMPYSHPIDMWSFGCILYELYVGQPLFPGEDEKDHMALMMEVKGVPPRSVLARATRRKVFFDEDYRPIIVPNSKGKLRVPGSKNLGEMINTQDADFVDFIDVSANLTNLRRKGARLNSQSLAATRTRLTWLILFEYGRNALNGRRTRV